MFHEHLLGVPPVACENVKIMAEIDRPHKFIFDLGNNYRNNYRCLCVITHKHLYQSVFFVHI